MPKVLERRRAIEFLESQITARVIIDALFGSLLTEEDDGSDTLDHAENPMADFLGCGNLLVYVEALRYFGPRDTVPKSGDFLANILPNLDEFRFKQEVRMSFDGFHRVATLMSENRVFYNDSKCAQASYETQLMVAFYRFGHHGNAASVGDIARRFGIWEGTVELYTNRTIVALLSIEKQFVAWPEPAEKSAIKGRILQRSGFPDCVGHVDGALIVFEYKPKLEGSDYWSHKSRYGISAMVVCDDTRRVRHLNVGFCGSAHDNRVFDNSKMGRSPELFFGRGEYVLADSAYTTSTTVVASYKKPAALLRENEMFNYFHSSQRITIEHCIGMAKGKFQSMRGLRTYVVTAKDHQRMVYWIRACFILHNILLDDYYDENWTEHEPRDHDVSIRNVPDKKSGQEGKKKREDVKKAVLKRRV